MQKKDNFIALLAILGTAFLGAGNGVAVKIAVREVEPLFLVFVRCVIAFICILPLFLKEKVYWDKNSFKIILLSLLNIGNVTLFTFGIAHTSVTAAAILYTLSPVIALIASYLLLKESIGKNKIVSVILGLIGAAIIILQPLSGVVQNASGSLIGNIIIFCAVLSFTLYTVLSKKFASAYSPIYLTTYFIASCAILMLALSLSSFSKHLSELITISSLSIGALIFTGIGTVGFYVLYQYAIKHGGPVVATMTQYLVPVFAFLMGFLLFQDRLTIDIFIGGIMAFVAAYLATRTSGKNQPAIVEPT